MSFKLKITRASGEVIECPITPAIEVAFEDYAKMGFHKAFREEEKQRHLYWLAWECVRRSGESVKPFGDEFLTTLAKVEVIESDPLA